MILQSKCAENMENDQHSNTMTLKIVISPELFSLI